MSNEFVYHVVTATDWARWQDKPTYEAGSLASEGFIHLSTEEQVAGVLERYYQGVPDLLLVQIDPARLTHELKYDVSTNNDRFPHLYGPLNKDAVVSVATIR
ncbi:DUF952 domain-containing protein [Fibrisoma montanum]|uniref:DUF952 domain-containing protein n=1 Tax=Fibrisoma montanum TaxID=2305895 RepID=A0A418MK11_9BACT|nr:DUF952 domain-containing protein [Fibrisoma montanum]RIV27683.1 DUF952 domain-containing protein [Fibrisoma montanum]